MFYYIKPKHEWVLVSFNPIHVRHYWYGEYNGEKKLAPNPKL